MATYTIDVQLVNTPFDIHHNVTKPEQKKKKKEKKKKRKKKRRTRKSVVHVL